MTTTIATRSGDLELGPMGLGTNVWGGRDEKPEASARVLEAALAAGITLVDTAEIYQGGSSELSIARALASWKAAGAGGARPVILSKFFPWPWRVSRSSLIAALHASLGRLGLEAVDVYLLHFPLPPLSLETWVDALADAVDAGLASAVGISNCDEKQLRLAHRVLADRGLPLACDEVEFSLLNRAPERNGTLAACAELGVPLVAYRPLGSGILPAAAPTTKGLRKLMAPRTDPRRLEELRSLLASIGAAHGGKSPSQIALNWVIAKGAVPIPGARSLAHLRENAGALGWSLSEEEVALLDAAGS